MRKNEISIDSRPLTVTYADTSYMMSVLNGNKQWLYTQYTQLYYETGFTFYVKGYDACPLIECELLRWDETDDKNIVDFIIRMINDGYCVVIELDQYYIPGVRTYMDHHYEHSMMIYGFDDTNESFQIVGFNKYRNYKSSIASFDDVAMGFHSLRDNKHIPLRLLKCKDGVNYQIDWGKIEYDFQAYIESGSRELMYKVGDRLFGLDVVSKVKEGIIAETESATFSLDPRPMSLLRDHKLIMLEKVKYFASLDLKFSHDEVVERFTEIKDLSIVCMNLLLKYEITNDKKALERLVRTLDDIVYKEKMVYPLVALAIGKYMRDISWSKQIGFNGD